MDAGSATARCCRRSRSNLIVRDTERSVAFYRAVVSVPVVDKGHGWREVCVRDPDGYEWAVGELIPPATGP